MVGLSTVDLKIGLMTLSYSSSVILILSIVSNLSRERYSILCVEYNFLIIPTLFSIVFNSLTVYVEL